MNIVSAGMPGPLLLRGNELHVLQLAGIPPGLFPEVTYDVLKVQLVPGDSVLFFTDGLTDARNVHDEDFDLEGLKDVCHQHAGDRGSSCWDISFGRSREFSADCQPVGRYDGGRLPL